MDKLNQLRIDLANKSDEVRSKMLGRMLGYINQNVENGKTSIDINDFYRHLNKMYVKFEKGN